MHGLKDIRPQGLLHFAEHFLLRIHFSPEYSLPRYGHLRLKKHQLITEGDHVSAGLLQQVIRQSLAPQSAHLPAVDPDVKQILL